MLVLLHKTTLVIFFPPFSPELFLFCQKVWGWGVGGGNCPFHLRPCRYVIYTCNYIFPKQGMGKMGKNILDQKTLRKITSMERRK